MDILARTRRGLLKIGWQSAATVMALGGATLQAASGSGRGRILVHLYLGGGNDSNNMLVPLEDRWYRRYAQARGPLAIPREVLLPVTANSHQGLPFGFHPALREVAGLYQRNRAAVIANTGGSLPGQLLSDDLNYIDGGYITPAWAPAVWGYADHFAVKKHTLTLSTGVNIISAQAQEDPEKTAKLIESTTLFTEFPDSAMGVCMKQAAALIKNSDTVVGRGSAVISITKSGFNTQYDQQAQQARLFEEIDAALAAFFRAIDEIPAADRVTLYTQTEFNRTLVPNKRGGTEAAWGGHQLAIGSSVLGGDIYGAFPDLIAGGPSDASNGAGSWRPTTPSDDYHATLARWIGAPEQVARRSANAEQAAPLTGVMPRPLNFLV